MVATVKAAGFPGQNGKIVFSPDRDGNSEFYTKKLDSTGEQVPSAQAADPQPRGGNRFEHSFNQNAIVCL
jgi:hypothetical protein